jgi:galactokinase
VVSECARVRQVVEMLATGARFPGDLALASHASLRDDYEASSKELDWIVDYAMRQRGITGARLTGAGWGGCAIAFGDEDALRALEASLPNAYQQAIGHEPRTWLVSADDGARVDG